MMAKEWKGWGRLTSDLTLVVARSVKVVGHVGQPRELALRSFTSGVPGVTNSPVVFDRMVLHSIQLMKARLFKKPYRCPQHELGALIEKIATQLYGRRAQFRSELDR
jgi:hypothetical protein